LTNVVGRVFFAVWKSQKSYLKLGNTDGSSPHVSAPPIAIHFILGKASSTSKLLGKAINKGEKIIYRPPCHVRVAVA